MVLNPLFPLRTRVELVSPEPTRARIVLAVDARPLAQAGLVFGGGVLALAALDAFAVSDLALATGIGCILGLGGVAAYIWARLVCRRFSGELELNARTRMLRVGRGLKGLDWAFLRLPEAGVIVLERCDVSSGGKRRRGRIVTKFKLTVSNGASQTVAATPALPAKTASPSLPPSMALACLREDHALRQVGLYLSHLLNWSLDDRTPATPSPPGAPRPGSIRVQTNVLGEKRCLVYTSPPLLRHTLQLAGTLIALAYYAIQSEHVAHPTVLAFTYVLAILAWICLLGTRTELVADGLGLRLTQSCELGLPRGRTQRLAWTDVRALRAIGPLDGRTGCLQVETTTERQTVVTWNAAAAAWLSQQAAVWAAANGQGRYLARAAGEKTAVLPATFRRPGT